VFSRIFALFQNEKWSFVTACRPPFVEVDLSVKKFRFIWKYIFLLPVMVVGALIGILLLWSVIPMIFIPMRRPASMIRNHVLRHTPIGMCIEEVIEVIENNERWGAPTVNRRSGFIIQGGGVPDFPIFSVIGEQSVQTRPEVYNVPLFHERRTRIFWGFDEDGKLIEVVVSSSFAPRIG